MKKSRTITCSTCSEFSSPNRPFKRCSICQAWVCGPCFSSNKRLCNDCRLIDIIDKYAEIER